MSCSATDSPSPTLQAVIKEGGKKGVEIEGASDMGGLDFFCTTIDVIPSLHLPYSISPFSHPAAAATLAVSPLPSRTNSDEILSCRQTPEGDCDLLLVAMDAMNADPDPEAEDRKGCSGHVGKMIFSAGTKQLAIVAYVPDSAHNKSAGNVDVQVWTETVCAAVNGKILKPAADAKSPKGGKVVVAVVTSDPDNGKYAIKDKDAAMAAAFNFLREKASPCFTASRLSRRMLPACLLRPTASLIHVMPFLADRVHSRRTMATLMTSPSSAMMRSMI